MLPPDTVLAGKYVIKRSLESGGMGDVYDAWETELSRPVAIKLLRPDLLDDPASFLRFQREAQAAASLGHPNIVRVLDFKNEPDQQPMLIMEKLEGRSLRELLEEVGTFPPPRAAFIALQILSALAAAHDAKIVHRDMKPANVFIMKTFAVRDFVKVLDFGVAKLLDVGSGAPVLTDLGQVLGTASYMAPEQAKGLQVDGRADLFAVGCILFELLSGQRPRIIGPAGLLDVGRRPCQKLGDVAPSLDPALAKVIDRALSLDPSARFPTAEVMAKALAPFVPQELLGGFGATAKMAPDPEHSPATTIGEGAKTVTAMTAQAPIQPAAGHSQSAPTQPLAAPIRPSNSPSVDSTKISSSLAPSPSPQAVPTAPPHSHASGMRAVVVVAVLVVLGVVAFIALGR